MRWIWLDRILSLDPGKSLVAIKNVSAAEEVLHDHFPAEVTGDENIQGHPALPVMPNTLVIEGMAQAAGILVGHTGKFAEKVILAKVGRATFTGLPAGPGTTLRHSATLERFDASGASATGEVHLLDPADPSAEPQPYAHIELVFAHIDQNRAGTVFPEHNFVFTDQFMDLLDRSGIPRS